MAEQKQVEYNFRMNKKIHAKDGSTMTIKEFFELDPSISNQWMIAQGYIKEVKMPDGNTLCIVTNEGIAFYQYDLEMPGLDLQRLQAMANTDDKDLKKFYMQNRGDFVDPLNKDKDGNARRLPSKKGWRSNRKK